MNFIFIRVYQVFLGFLEAARQWLWSRQAPLNIAELRDQHAKSSPASIKCSSPSPKRSVQFSSASNEEFDNVEYTGSDVESDGANVLEFCISYSVQVQRAEKVIVDNASDKVSRL
jgi:hypothetical protein